jgi:hypothetical protein
MERPRTSRLRCPRETCRPCAARPGAGRHVPGDWPGVCGSRGPNEEPRPGGAGKWRAPGFERGQPTRQERHRARRAPERIYPPPQRPACAGWAWKWVELAPTASTRPCRWWKWWVRCFDPGAKTSRQSAVSGRVGGLGSFAAADGLPHHHWRCNRNTRCSPGDVEAEILLRLPRAGREPGGVFAAGPGTAHHFDRAAAGGAGPAPACHFDDDNRAANAPLLASLRARRPKLHAGAAGPGWLLGWDACIACSRFGY